MNVYSNENNCLQIFVSWQEYNSSLKIIGQFEKSLPTPKHYASYFVLYLQPYTCILFILTNNNL